MGAVASYGCVSNVTYGGGEHSASNLHSFSCICWEMFDCLHMVHIALHTGPLVVVGASAMPSSKSKGASTLLWLK